MLQATKFGLGGWTGVTGGLDPIVRGEEIFVAARVRLVGMAPAKRQKESEESMYSRRIQVGNSDVKNVLLRNYKQRQAGDGK